MNDYCEFPRKLNMMAYTQNYLKKKEKEKSADDMENEENVIIFLNYYLLTLNFQNQTKKNLE